MLPAAFVFSAGAARWSSYEASVLDPSPSELNKEALKAHETGGPLAVTSGLRQDARGAL